MICTAIPQSTTNSGPVGSVRGVSGGKDHAHQERTESRNNAQCAGEAPDRDRGGVAVYRSGTSRQAHEEQLDQKGRQIGGVPAGQAHLEQVPDASRDRQGEERPCNAAETVRSNPRGIRVEPPQNRHHRCHGQLATYPTRYAEQVKEEADLRQAQIVHRRILAAVAQLSAPVPGRFPGAGRVRPTDRA